MSTHILMSVKSTPDGGTTIFVVSGATTPFARVTAVTNSSLRVTLRSFHDGIGALIEEGYE